MNAEMLSNEEHIPVPIDEARRIANAYRKSMVVILTYDPESEMTHTTTYGVEPFDKERAAEVGEACAKLICGEGFAERTIYSDYRFIAEGERAKQIEQLRQLLVEAASWIKLFRLGTGDHLSERIDKTLQSLGES